MGVYENLPDFHNAGKKVMAHNSSQPRIQDEIPILHKKSSMTILLKGDAPTFKIDFEI